MIADTVRLMLERRKGSVDREIDMVVKMVVGIFIAAAIVSIVLTRLGQGDPGFGSLVSDLIGRKVQ
ncbi:MAG: hypothetical protein ABEJ07_01945 [Candidatus Nanohaloarchaea archaeon]